MYLNLTMKYLLFFLGNNEKGDMNSDQYFSGTCYTLNPLQPFSCRAYSRFTVYRVPQFIFRNNNNINTY